MAVPVEVQTQERHYDEFQPTIVINFCFLKGIQEDLLTALAQLPRPAGEAWAIREADVERGGTVVVTGRPAPVLLVLSAKSGRRAATSDQPRAVPVTVLTVSYGLLIDDTDAMSSLVLVAVLVFRFALDCLNCGGR